LCQSTRHAPDDDNKRRQCAQHVDDELDDVVPDHRFGPTHQRVNDRNRSQHDHGGRQVQPQHDLQHQGGQEQAQRIADIARTQEQHRGRPAAHLAKARLEHGVGCEYFTTEIQGQQEVYDQEPAHNVTDGNLQKGQVAAPGGGNTRQAEKGDRAGFRSNDRQQQSTPWQGTATQEIIRGIALSAPHPKAKKGQNRQQVDDNNRGVHGVDIHGKIHTVVMVPSNAIGPVVRADHSAYNSVHTYR